jgi:uncharacterized protein (DUF433 family)
MPIKHEADLDRITCNPHILGGVPIVRGTRLPVDRVLERLEIGHPEEVFAAFPMLDEDDLRACIRYARLAVAR